MILFSSDGWSDYAEPGLAASIALVSFGNEIQLRFIVSSVTAK